MYVCMHIYLFSVVRVISISDDVYEKLVRIKGDKSFSEVLRELLRAQEKSMKIRTR